MEKRSLKTLCSYIEGAICPQALAGRDITAVCTDTRELTPGCLFIPIKGARFDGHDYISAAIRAGASAALSERPIEGLPVVLVSSTRLALMQIAAGYRREFTPRVCGVTGSVGKTTVKEMIASVFSTRWKTLKNEGNLNNNIGLPLSVLRLEQEYEAAVFEMGMSARGEIAALTRIAAPDIAVITNIGIAHIEYLGSREHICEAKLEIAEGLSPGGRLILNGDEPLLWRVRDRFDPVPFYFGIENRKADIRAHDIITSATGSGCTILHRDGSFGLDIPEPGRHNIVNALAAAAVGLCMELTPDEIAAGIKNFKNTGMRQRIYDYNGVTIIEDCYNANPESMRAALSVLTGLPASGTRIAVLGSMLELGDYAQEAHCEVGVQAAKAAEYAVFCGPNAAEMTKGAVMGGMLRARIHIAKDAEDAGQIACDLVKKGDAVLFKGSRGMRMEDALAQLKASWL